MAAQITFLPDAKRIEVRPGTTVLDAAGKARVTLRVRCGGKAACMMCKVVARDGQGLSPISQKERLKLGSLADQGYRLACQTKIVGQAEVEVPEDPLKAAIRRQLELQRKEEEL
ncbi:2Fe-2S iron-sulfur cluster-binding protein [Paenibacillus sp. GD4]|jgi:ferredoxin, 2Fe-2S|uniref:2Fe-2S iron-sulfur cluster-binding protein n=1 Tax=Paenibacillus sp. GD4 TaxID=3068890 RepID=UPI002796C533|nr:2Fe-2S iron-sulfur cluster-binding protein [Paenibacillus sp. GD4]MDQ1909427.1 2Fe-2S iron-sulfur cluster-binding protein [Paenibacillus sp. GD4]